jgi:porin
MWRFLIACLAAGSIASAGMAESREEAAAADPQVEQEVNHSQAAEEVEEADDLVMSNPGSIAEQYKRDRERKEYLFQIPGADKLLKPWSELRTHLDENYGFRPTLSFTHLYQHAGDTVGPEDDASGLELVIDATWTFLGRGTDSPTMAGFEFLYRDKAGTDIPPVALFGQVGSLYPTSVAFAEIGPTLGQLWIQQIFDNRFGFRVGRFFPVPVYDFFPLKNFRMDFVDGIHAANLVIPLPDRGLGAYTVYRPQPNIYFRLGLHDANADAEKAGFDTFFEDGELFKIFEVGFDPGLMKRQKGRPPFGDVHVSFWHQDERDDANVNDGWGFVLSGSQRFGRFLPFFRYGYADSGKRGPVSIEHMVNGGVAIDNILGQRNDRIGTGLTWSRPVDGALDDQRTVDVFYRVQVTPQIAVTPMVQVIFDPVRSPNEDVVVLGIRSRFMF